MPNAWVEHIKKYAKDNNVSYGYVCMCDTYVCIYVCINVHALTHARMQAHT